MAARRQYRNAAGERLPGVTTVCGVMEKPALKYWGNKIGLAGISIRDYVDDLAAAGTLAHAMVEADLTGVKLEQTFLDDFSATNIDRAENAMLAFLEWKGSHEITVSATEVELVSEELQTGGRIDCYCQLDGVWTELDFKTGKAIYSDMWTQVAGYDLLLQENGFPVDQAAILRIGREESEGFEFLLSPDREGHQARFRICRELFSLNKQLDKKKGIPG